MKTNFNPVLTNRECTKCHTNIILEVQRNEEQELQLLYTCNCGRSVGTPYDISINKIYELNRIIKTMNGKFKKIKKDISLWKNVIIKVNGNIIDTKNIDFSNPYITLTKDAVKFAIIPDNKDEIAFIKTSNKFDVIFRNLIHKYIQIITDNDCIELSIK